MSARTNPTPVRPNTSHPGSTSSESAYPWIGRGPIAVFATCVAMSSADGGKPITSVKRRGSIVRSTRPCARASVTSR